MEEKRGKEGWRGHNTKTASSPKPRNLKIVTGLMQVDAKIIFQNPNIDFTDMKQAKVHASTGCAS